ncbi:Sporulation kinase D [Anoxybacillus thermarum]|uniref:Sporulation kinase D n=2 Tax=Anoxybacillus thermarum TaxID=404937 RepID=A0A0D0QZN0_9BACL|nr:Sporulation kinase D [Anoxybacillus thermarum]
MGRERTRRWLYILLVIVPCLIGSMWIVRWQDEQQQQQLLEETKLFANIHKNDLDRFLAETTARLETLAIVMGKHIATLKKEEINDILQQMQKQGVSQDFVENIFSVHYGCCQSLVSEPFSGIDIVSAFGLSSLILK